MKTTTYKTGNVMRSIVASLIILASLQGIAKGENSGKGAIGIVENESTLQVEIWMSNLVYDAQEFVADEMAFEIQNWTNSNDSTNNEVVEAEPALQIAALMNNIEYKAQEFVDAEMAVETESWMNSNDKTNSEVAEAEPALLIAALANNTEYKAQEFVAAEMAIETENWMNNSNYVSGSEKQTNYGIELAHN